MLEFNPNVMMITETWLNSAKNKTTADIKEFGYNMYHKIRKNREKELGGGVGVMVKNDIKGKLVPSKDYHSFEISLVRVPLTGNKHLLLVVIYRLQYVPIAEFLSEFSDLLEMVTNLHQDFIIAGDINIHVETTESNAVKFQSLLDVYDLRQHVFGSTHVKGHTIDIVISPNKDQYVTDINIRHIEPHHHFLVEFVVHVSAISNSSKQIKFRNLKNIDNIAFKEELKHNLEQRKISTNVSEHVNEYNSVLSDLLDKYAPVKQKIIRTVSTAPWFDSEYKKLRKQRRKAEKKYRKSKSQVDKNLYIQLKKRSTQLCKEKKKTFIANRLRDGSSKSLFSVVNRLTDNTKDTVLPSSDSDEELAQKFANFFQAKIDKIRVKLDESVDDPAPTLKDRQNSDVKKLDHFRLTTAEEISSIIKDHGIKCSPADPLPAVLLETHKDILLPVWTVIVNLSLITGSIDSLKCADILPLIKELCSSTDIDDLKNYRPISNLLFVSKLIERVIDIRLQEHLEANNLNHDKQYGYKKFHSTEMLLNKVFDNLLQSCDKKIPSVMLLLDLSAAFDTVDHDKLLNILSEDIKITGTALSWFSSFLKERTQRVKVGDSLSHEKSLKYGVAQGSILGPRLFNLYIQSLYKHVSQTKFNIEGFADDHQLVKQFVVAMQPVALGHNIRDCLESTAAWMKEYFLCLNESKTKILVIAPPSIRKDICIDGVILAHSCIRFVESAKNLGVIIDNALEMDDQINRLAKSCYTTIRTLSKIRHYLSTKQLQQLVCSRILLPLDYCNSLYYGLTETNIQKLQRVQNCAARLVHKFNPPCNKSTDNLISDLHWLKIKLRIIYKILLLVHNCINSKAPNQMIALINLSESGRTKRLIETKFMSSYGARAFSHSGPKLWNLLPINMQEQSDTNKFKKQLKTFLLTCGDEFISSTKIK